MGSHGCSLEEVNQVSFVLTTCLLDDVAMHVVMGKAFTQHFTCTSVNALMELDSFQVK